MRNTKYDIRYTKHDEAGISEIFLSYQGEGPFVGSRQLFVRFYGCNLNCEYCDTSLESYKCFSREALLGKVLDFDDDYNELTLTGGEPLLHADFIRGFLTLFKRHRDHKVYLETNGTLPEKMKKIIDLVDTIAMDVKLPSSSGSKSGMWNEHAESIDIAAQKELVVKAVVTASTTMDDIKKMGGILSGTERGPVIVLQPVTPVNENVGVPDGEMMSYFKAYLKKETGLETVVLGQVHKYLGIR
ncbi:MAG: 7-carboxy-7-deazaguanine synthase QueE [Candidatus Tantalella remota]|nr:7-carboxy-7-deazaguanine synthase QueE [Candidatus Tantalella remota]